MTGADGTERGDGLLVTVSGRDRPGITSRLFDSLGGVDATVLDVEQVVIRGRLVLGVLLRAPAGAHARVQRSLESALAPLGMDVEVTAGAADEGPHRRGRSHVTVLGHPLRPAALAGIAGCIADYGGNIDRIVRIAHYPVTGVQLEVSGADPGAAAPAARARRGRTRRRRRRRAVRPAPPGQAAGRARRRLHPGAGRGHRDARRAPPAAPTEVAGVTEAAMRGELDFAESLRARVRPARRAGRRRRGRGTPRARSWRRGARTFVRTLKRLGLPAGDRQRRASPRSPTRLVAELGIDYAAANTLEIVDGRLTGGLVGPVVDRAGKAAALERFARQAGVPVSQTVAIGDGANDLDMLARAGLGIAYNAKPVVRVAADAARQRALPRRDPVPARHLPRGDRGGRRRRGHRRRHAADLTPARHLRRTSSRPAGRGRRGRCH